MPRPFLCAHNAAQHFIGIGYRSISHGSGLRDLDADAGACRARP